MSLESVRNKLLSRVRELSVEGHPESNSPYYLICATLDKRGNIISIGTNSYIKTHSLQAKYAKKLNFRHKIFLHAEISALVKARSQVHSVMVLRVTKAGKIGNAEPCPICRMALKEAGVINMIYSNDVGELEIQKVE